MQKHFKPFVQAADKAFISRFYSGIHYLKKCKYWAEQWKKASDYVLSNLKL